MEDYDDVDLAVLDALTMLRSVGVSLMQAQDYLAERSAELWDYAMPEVLH